MTQKDIESARAVPFKFDVGDLVETPFGDMVIHSQYSKLKVLGVWTPNYSVCPLNSKSGLLPKSNTWSKSPLMMDKLTENHLTLKQKAYYVGKTRNA